MLPFRRIIAFSSRVHTYLLGLFLFFAIIYFLTLAFPADMALVTLVFYALDLISWTMIFFGAWILAASVIEFLLSKVFIVAPVLLTLLRCAVMMLLGLVIGIFENLIIGGISV